MTTIVDQQHKADRLKVELQVVEQLQALSPYQAKGKMTENGSLGVSLKQNPQFKNLKALETAVNKVLNVLDMTCTIPEENDDYDNDTIFISNFKMTKQVIHESLINHNVVEKDKQYINTVTLQTLNMNI